MEYLTNSAGIQHVFSQCSHKAIIGPFRSIDYNSHTLSTFPNFSNSLTSIPRNKSLTYGSTVLYPTEKNMIRSSSSMGVSSNIIVPRRRTGSTQYDSMNDPHLRDFFERKFKLSTAKKRRPKERKPGPNELVYKVKVKTGNCNNASTDANVYITICGKRGDLPRKHLFNKYNAILSENGQYKFKFERNSVNIFKLIGIDVGQISHIIVEHDGTNLHSSWFLQEIMITNTKLNRSWLFECNDWLSLDHGLGKTRIQLLPSKQIQKYTKTDYKIVTVTGDHQGAGTDANVFITLIGKHNKSSQRMQLKNGAIKNLFERGKSDPFKLTDVNYVGPIKKVRIEHDNTGRSPGWFLERLVVTDLKDPGVNYFCLCSKWLDKNKDDGLISRELIATEDPLGAKKITKYNITVYTGNMREGGTGSDIFLTLFGSVGESDEFKLENNGNNFQRAGKDTYPIECPSVGEIMKLKIGHREPLSSWFLNKVIVDDTNSGRVYEFNCDEWLSERDGKTFVFLYPGGKVEDVDASKGKNSVWNVSVFTSDIKKAGTDANVQMVIYGDRGKTDEKLLKNKGEDNFGQGKRDNFRIETENIGKPFKIRIWHDNSGKSPNWHLDRIELENVDSKEKYYFICKKWLSKEEDDHEIVREIPAEGESIPKPLPLVNYIVEVYTGNKQNAGTDADVFINIFGDYGDTGERWLERSETNKNRFEKNKVDVFRIEAVTLKNLKKIRIGHNGKNAGAGWFLDKVVVKQDKNSKYDQTFECKRWLAVDEDDGLIVRELFANGGGSQFLDTHTYNVKVKTGDVRNAGTDGNVRIKIFGTKGDTGDRNLKHSDTTSNPFERNRLDEFKIEADDIGKIEKIQIGHDSKGAAPAWFLDYVEIDVPSKGLRYKFSYHDWLDSKKSEIELEPTDVIKMRRLIPYVITTKTGDKRGAGTDANVFIQLYGLEGKSEEHFLDNKTNNFEKGQEDVFKIEAEDVGPIYKIRIGHDNKGTNSGWYLEKLNIQRHAIKDAKHGSTVSLDTEIETYHFFVNKWFATDEDDRQIVRELIPTDEDGRPLIEIEEVPYEVKVFTGDVSGAGTDSNVFINIYGQNGDSGERELKKSDKANKFERNQVDTFKVKAIELGELFKIKIRHDNSRAGSAWFLEKVEIYNPNTNKTYLFNYQDWLSEKEGRGKISVELPAIDPAQLKKVTFRQGAKNLKDQFLLETEALTTTYNVIVKTSDKRGAGTDANVYIQLFGENNDSGKIPLETSKTNKNKFEAGNEDVFEVKESDVGDLRKIRIGHDGRSPGAGWHLKEVIVDAPKLGKRWRFPCGRWLDKNEDDGKIERELYPKDVSFEEYMPHVPYEISIYTSDIRGADTSANPYIVLYGEEIHTQKYDLCKNKAERRDKFKRGACDKFVLEMEDIGKEIKKIRIGHDNHGLSAGWHIDRVEIRRLKQSGKGSKIFVFPCNRWLARDEDDKAIERDLVASKLIDEKFENGEIKSREKDLRDQYEMKDYTVDVYTGNVSGAGTDANVFITLYGDLGDSGEKKLLKSQTHKNKFEKNQMDRFVVQAADLGKLFKVFIRHDNSSFSSDWFLDRVEVTENRNTYLFICERWLSKSKEDKQIERTLFEKNYRGPRITSTSSLSLKSNIGGSKIHGSDPKLSIRQQSPFGNYRDEDGPTIPYKITIRTGDEKKCGISSQAFIRLFGENGKTERIMLQLAKKKRFEPGSSETFQIDAFDVGELRKVELGHDGVNESWFVKHIEIVEAIKGRSYFITCNSWLSEEKGDGKAIRKFNVDEETTKITSFRGLLPYTVTICTGDLPKAGTDNNVTLKFFGSKGNSDDIFIEKIENRFDRASIETLNIEMDDIGALKKVRVSIDGKGSRREWYLDRIELTNMKTKRQYVFIADEWLSKTREGSRGLTIDVPLFKNDEKTIGTTDYKISVKTSDLSGAGTDANVFVNIFGENGDTGELELKKSETNLNKFERGKTDVFVFKNKLSLGELTKLRIWHDNSGSLIGNTHWHLDSVLVEDLNSRKSYKFDCKKWLSKSKDDKQIVRELSLSSVDGEDGPLTPRPGDRTTYEISIQTADERDAGTKQNVEIVLVGENNQETKPKVFENTNENKILRRGQLDQIIFKAKSVGNLKKIFLSHIEKYGTRPDERTPNWICDYVKIKDLETGTTYKFPVMDKIQLNKPPKMFRCELKKDSMVNMTRSLKNLNYEIIVVTGSEKGAGTNANAFITIFGENGDSGKRPLKKGFEPNQTDKFMLECLDLGEIKKVHVEHDNTSFKKDWFLDRVEVVDPHTGKKIIFPCNKWLSKNKEDGEIGRDLYPLQDENERSGSRLSSRSPKGSRRDLNNNFDYRDDSRPSSRNSRDKFYMEDKPIKKRNFIEDDYRPKSRDKDRFEYDDRANMFRANSARRERPVNNYDERDLYSRSPQYRRT